jgi:hypothetical protein
MEPENEGYVEQFPLTDPEPPKLNENCRTPLHCIKVGDEPCGCGNG